MVQGFSKQHLCNRNLTKIRIPEIPVHDPRDSRSPNPYRPKSAANNEPPNHQMTPIINRSRPGHLENHAHRGAGFDIVPERPPGIAALPAQCHTGLPRAGRSGLLSRIRNRPPAWSQLSPLPPRDRADGATLGLWNAKASQRPRRPVSKESASGTATGAGTATATETATVFRRLQHHSLT